MASFGGGVFSVSLGWLSELAVLPGARRIKAVLRTNEGWCSFNFTDGMQVVKHSGHRRDSRLELIFEGEALPDVAELEQALRMRVIGSIGCQEPILCAALTHEWFHPILNQRFHPVVAQRSLQVLCGSLSCTSISGTSLSMACFTWGASIVLVVPCVQVFAVRYKSIQQQDSISSMSEDRDNSRPISLSTSSTKADAPVCCGMGTL